MQAILIRTLSPTQRNNNIRYKASCVASSNTVNQVGEFNLEQNVKNSVDSVWLAWSVVVFLFYSEKKLLNHGPH